MASNGYAGTPSKAASEKPCILMVGNPGAGKSTLLNCLIGEVRFRSGFSVGGGLTYELQKEDIPGKGVFLDTPGLTDVVMRKQAAKAISEALRQNGVYRIFFVITLDSGRVRPQDKVTIKLVTDACQAVPGFVYSIIINQLSKRAIQTFQDVGSGNGAKLRACLSEGVLVPADSLYFLESREELVDRDMKPGESLVCRIPEELQHFINNAPAVWIQKEKVTDVVSSEYEKLEMQYQERFSKLEHDLEAAHRINEEANRKLAETKDKMEKIRAENVKVVQGLRDTMKENQAQHEKELNNLRQDHQQKFQSLQNQMHEATRNRDARVKALEEQLQKTAEAAADEATLAALPDRWTIITAALDGNLRAVEAFLRRDPQSINFRLGDTALTCAAGEAQWEIVQCLVFARADINAKDEIGRTPLDQAYEWDFGEHRAFVRNFLELHGAKRGRDVS